MHGAIHCHRTGDVHGIRKIEATDGRLPFPNMTQGNPLNSIRVFGNEHQLEFNDSWGDEPD